MAGWRPSVALAKTRMSMHQASLTPNLAPPNLKAMEVQLTPAQTTFIREAIDNGRLHGEEDAVREAMALWEERERRRLEILAAVDRAEASLARGDGRRVAPDED